MLHLLSLSLLTWQLCKLAVMHQLVRSRLHFQDAAALIMKLCNTQGTVLTALRLASAAASLSEISLFLH